MGGSKGGDSGTQQSTTTTSIPPDVLKNYNAIVKQAQSVAGQPLQQYQGQLLADFTPQQQAAFSGINAAQGSYQPYFDQAQSLLSSSTGAAPTFDPSQLQQYMSPYNQDVINSTMALAHQNDAQQQSALTGNAISSGAWGGDRAGVAKATLAGQQQLADNSTIANLNNQNYTQALNQYNTMNTLGQQQNALNLQGAGIASNLGTSQFQNALTGAAANLEAGNQQQQQAQNALNIPYEQFQQQQQYPFQTTGWLANIVEGLGANEGGTSTTTTPSQQSSSKGSLFARGGRTGYAPGGYIMPESADYTIVPSPTINFSSAKLPQAPGIDPSKPEGNVLSSLLGSAESAYSLYKQMENPTSSLSDSTYSTLDNAGSQGISWNNIPETSDYYNDDFLPDLSFSKGGSIGHYDLGGGILGGMSGQVPNVDQDIVDPNSVGKFAQANLPNAPGAPNGGGSSGGGGNKLGQYLGDAEKIAQIATMFMKSGGKVSSPSLTTMKKYDDGGYVSTYGQNDALGLGIPTAMIDNLPLSYFAKNYSSQDMRNRIPSQLNTAMTPNGGIVQPQQQDDNDNVPAGLIGADDNNQQPTQGIAQKPQDSTSSGIDVPMLDKNQAIMAAGLATLAGSSPHAGENIGAGALAGLQNWQEQKTNRMSAQEKAADLAQKAEALKMGKYQPVQGEDGNWYNYNTKSGELEPLPVKLGAMAGMGISGRGAGVSGFLTSQYLNSHKDDPEYQGEGGKEQLQKDALDFGATRGQSQNAGKIAEDKKLGTGYGGQLEQYRKDAESAQELQSSMAQLQSEAKQFPMGWGAGLKAKSAAIGASLASSLGLPAEGLAEMAGNMQAFNKGAMQMTANSAKAAGERAFQAMQALQTANPNIEMTPQGFGIISAGINGGAQYKVDKYQASRKWLNDKKSMSGFDSDFQKKVTPFAYVVQNMPPEELKQFKTNMMQDKQGQAELNKIADQIDYIHQVQGE